MKEKAESRDTIKRNREKNKQEMDDRAKHMGLVVDDKKTVAETSHALRNAATTEGAEEVKQALRAAADATHREFKKQNQELQKTMDKCNEAEEDLRQRTGAAKGDANENKAAASKIKETGEARNSAQKAEQADEKDARFTDEERTKQANDRTTSEDRRDHQNNELENAKLA